MGVRNDFGAAASPTSGELAGVEGVPDMTSEGYGPARQIGRVYIGCMPRMQVYLSDDLYEVVKSQGLSASRLLQDAVRDHCVRQEKIAEAHAYAQEIFAELGPPTAEDIEWADTHVREILKSLPRNEARRSREPLPDAPTS